MFINWTLTLISLISPDFSITRDVNVRSTNLPDGIALYAYWSCRLKRLNIAQVDLQYFERHRIYDLGVK